jgi:phosphotriesterase-related protein
MSGDRSSDPSKPGRAQFGALDGAVMTVTGPVAARDLGLFDAHDHLLIDSPALPGQSLIDVDRAIEEVEEARSLGVSCIVEMTPIGLGRDPAGMRAIATATGVAVIATSGFHVDVHYPPDHWAHTESVEVLTERIVADLTIGMHPTDWSDPDSPLDPARAGAIKGGASLHHISPSERRRLEAIAAAAVQTGAAVLIHTELGTFGHEVVDMLEHDGMSAGRIILSHMDRNPDLELHSELADRGVTLEYNTLGRPAIHPDSLVLDLIESMAEAGHLERILIGLDFARRDYLRAYGYGPGLRYLLATIAPRLRRRVSESGVQQILATNPARVYALPIVDAAGDRPAGRQ